MATKKMIRYLVTLAALGAVCPAPVHAMKKMPGVILHKGRISGIMPYKTSDAFRFLGRGGRDAAGKLAVDRRHTNLQLHGYPVDPLHNPNKVGSFQRWPEQRAKAAAKFLPIPLEPVKYLPLPAPMRVGTAHRLKNLSSYNPSLAHKSLRGDTRVGDTRGKVSKIDPIRRAIRLAMLGATNPDKIGSFMRLRKPPIPSAYFSASGVFVDPALARAGNEYFKKTTPKFFPLQPSIKFLPLPASSAGSPAEKTIFPFVTSDKQHAQWQAAAERNIDKGLKIGAAFGTLVAIAMNIYLHSTPPSDKQPQVSPQPVPASSVASQEEIARKKEELAAATKKEEEALRQVEQIRLRVDDQEHLARLRVKREEELRALDERIAQEQMYIAQNERMSYHSSAEEMDMLRRRDDLQRMYKLRSEVRQLLVALGNEIARMSNEIE